MAIVPTYHNMAAIKCAKSRGYKPWNKTRSHPDNVQLGKLRTHRGLQELGSMGQVGIQFSLEFPCLMLSISINSHQVQLATSQLVRQMCFHLPIWALTLLLRKSKNHLKRAFWELDDFFPNAGVCITLFPMWYSKMDMKTGWWKASNCGFALYHQNRVLFVLLIYKESKLRAKELLLTVSLPQIGRFMGTFFQSLEFSWDLRFNAKTFFSL